MSYQFTITNAGRAAIVNAANTGTDAVNISEIAFGSTYAAATAARTALTLEVARIDSIGGGVVAPDTIHVTGSDSSDAVYDVREIGLFSDDGVLIAIYSQTTPILTKAAGTVALVAADLVITGLPADSVTVGDSSFSYPPATTSVKGVIEIATNEEAQAGTDTERAVTPAGLASVTATDTRRGMIEIATTAEAQGGADASRALTPKTLQDVTATTTRKGVIEIATDAEAKAGTDAERALTPSNLGAIRGAVLEALYPVGEIYITHRDGNPNALLGFGSWERYAAGRTLVGHNPSDADFDALDKTGGSKTVALSAAEMPAHTHQVDPPATTTSSAGAHTHQLNTGGMTQNTPNLANQALYAGTGKVSSSTTENGAHTHTIDIAPFSSGSAGNGQAHSNMQPFITVFMWKRMS